MTTLSVQHDGNEHRLYEIGENGPRYIGSAWQRPNGLFQYTVVRYLGGPGELFKAELSEVSYTSVGRALFTLASDFYGGITDLVWASAEVLLGTEELDHSLAKIAKAAGL